MFAQYTFQRPYPRSNLTYFKFMSLDFTTCYPFLLWLPSTAPEAPGCFLSKHASSFLLSSASTWRPQSLHHRTSDDLFDPASATAHPAITLDFGIMITRTSLEMSASSIPHGKHYLLCLQLIHSGISIPIFLALSGFPVH